MPQLDRLAAILAYTEPQTCGDGLLSTTGGGRRHFQMRIVALFRWEIAAAQLAMRPLALLAHAPTLQTIAANFGALVRPLILIA
ncbi:MAG: hypothetical protein GY820_18540 [Gammaproteobacteria bacterium]|nr:hypothetical protein [Gammaproteobacteria bacterium]